jgi:hypothetical protein
MTGNEKEAKENQPSTFAELSENMSCNGKEEV